MELEEYASVQTFIAKIRHTPSEKTESIQTLPAIQGVIDLENCLFKSAAINFLSIPFELSSSLWKYLSGRDIAIYGCLCALGSLNRSELKTKVMENSNFKQFLELEPRMTEVLRAFYYSKFTSCFEILDKLKVSDYSCMFLFRLERISIGYLSP